MNKRILLGSIIGGGVVLILIGVVLGYVMGSARSESSDDSDEASIEVVNDGLGRAEIFEEFYGKAEKLLQGMTLEEKVGQMFLVRFSEDSVEEEIEGAEPAGYILFGQDFRYETPETLHEKLQAYQQASKIGLIFGVDEEGGTVVRASLYPAFRAEPFKSPQELWNEGGVAEVLVDSTEKTKLLSSLGINMNLAPVADVSFDPEDFIYQRALGKSAEETAEYVVAIVGQMSRDGMISVMKHFPGYGNNVDTHTGIAVDERTYDQFEKEDFLPFRAGILAGGPCVLVSHNVITALDSEKPASLSPAVIGVLRNELDFSGVIMTDDLAMDAVGEYVNDGRAAVLAVLAGNDLIITSDFAGHKQEIIEAVRNGEIQEEMIDLAAKRVLAMKLQYQVIKKSA